jgi:hypothetical protein
VKFVVYNANALVSSTSAWPCVIIEGDDYQDVADKLMSSEEMIDILEEIRDWDDAASVRISPFSESRGIQKSLKITGVD